MIIVFVVLTFDNCCKSFLGEDEKQESRILFVTFLFAPRNTGFLNGSQFMFANKVYAKHFPKGFSGNVRRPVELTFQNNCCHLAVFNLPTLLHKKDYLAK